ncbi:MAG: hypothetical protein WCX73_04670, partial [Candidatus Pacearchaeota archaeon]
LILPGLILLSIIIVFWIIKIINKNINRRKIRQALKREAEILRNNFTNKNIIQRDVKKTEEVFSEITNESKEKGFIIYTGLIKEYNKNYKKLDKFRKKIFKKREKLIKKENKIGRPLENKRKKFKQELEQYKRSISKLEELKKRIKKLEETGHFSLEAEKLKHQLEEDIENLKENQRK